MNSENIILLAFFVTLLFLIMKFIEMRFIEKEYKPLKYVVRDAIMVFFSTVTTNYAFIYMNGTVKDFMNVITETKTLDPESTQIFTDLPGV